MTGIKATVRFKSGETLERVAQLLHESLPTPPFWFDSDQESPHAITAMTECLGFEVWLRAENSGGPQAYVMTIESSMDVADRFRAHMSDVSEWLAKYICTVTHLECVSVASSEKNA